MSATNKKKRIVILGGSCSGRSELVVRFVNEAFFDEHGRYDPGIEDTFQKVVTVDGKSIPLEIIDTVRYEIDEDVK